MNKYIPNVETFTNSKEFSYLAEFFNENNMYTNLPRGTYEYKLFWEDVKDKCINGITNFCRDSICNLTNFSNTIRSSRQGG